MFSMSTLQRKKSMETVGKMENIRSLFVEPASKKLKMNESKELNNIKSFIDTVIHDIKESKNNLTPIVDDEFTRKIPNVPVHVATIRNLKDISKIILKLNAVFPLSELQHLKRIRKPQIIIGSVMKIGENNIQEYLEEKCEGIKDLLEHFTVAEVPGKAPKLKWQFDESNKYWPINFHPNKYNECLVSGDFFTKKDLVKHRMYMAVAFEVAKISARDNSFKQMELENGSISKDIAGTVIVDPKIDSIIAISHDNRLVNPLQHSAMTAIDNVAKSQNGGAWNTEKETMKNSVEANFVLEGIEENYLKILREKFPDLKFGGKKFVPKGRDSERTMTEDVGPYLCTDYYVYTIHEPCVMCSMALVHARARRIFFACENITLGSLKSKCKLQTIKSLNHHFEVFTGFLN